jgi:hypothetical protein
VIRGAILAVAGLVAVCPAPVAAQSPDPPRTETAPRVEFLSRTHFLISGEHLSSPDPRYVWAGNFGADLDVLEYRAGRATFLANYEVVMGEEIRSFDPNQGNYILAGSASLRLRALEIAGVFHHESRHLSDRIKRAAVDWNMVGGRLAHRWRRPSREIASQIDVRGVIVESYVDYRWEIDARTRLDIALSPRVGLLAAGAVRRLAVDGSRARGPQAGFRAEAGARVAGGAGASEVFVAFERRIDPYPLQFSTEDWITVGFRLMTR